MRTRQPPPCAAPPPWTGQDHAAILFDCDGTLADTMPAHYRAWVEVTAVHGIVFREERFYALAGRPTRDIVATLAAEVGVAIDVDRAARLKEERFLAQLEHVGPIDPVIDVVRRTSGRIPIAVVTGGHRAVCLRILERVGIADRFDTIVASEDTLRHKPDPEPFLEAARRLGADPARCVVWEDSDLGIAAAEAAGMEWVDVRAFHPPRRSIP
jgi:HAD superfamily hydrolase (TIGR01509 family)